MGGQGGEQGWSNQMLSSMDYIKSNTERFRAFLPEETQHCILPYENFYTIEADGVLLVDWLDDMINDQPIQNRSCELCTTMMP